MEPKYIFDRDDNLGQVVSVTQPFCMVSDQMQITDISQITSDLCGHKFSKLCGFIFKSSHPATNGQKFMVVYCPKTRSNYARNNRGLSGWYCWKHVGPREEIIMSKSDMRATYGFDVDKFFQSDKFLSLIPIFRQQVRRALATTMLQFAQTLTGRQAKEAKFYMDCIADSLNRIEDVTKISDGGSTQAKLAYNADKTYSLNMRNTLNTWDGTPQNEAERNHGFPEYEFNNLADFDSFTSMLYNEYDLTDRDHVIFRDKNGLEHKIVGWHVLNNGVTFDLD